MRRFVGSLLIVVMMMTLLSAVATAAPSVNHAAEQITLYDKYPDVPITMTSKKGATLYLYAYSAKEQQAKYYDAESIKGLLAGVDTMQVSGFETLRDYNVLPATITALGTYDKVSFSSEWCGSDPDSILDFDRTEGNSKWYGPGYVEWELNITWTYDWCNSLVITHDYTANWEAIGYTVTQETHDGDEPSDRAFWDKYQWRFEHLVPRMGGFTKWVKGSVYGTQISWTGDI